MPSRWPFLVLFCPHRYLALIVSRSSANFYVGFDHPCGKNNATLRMYLPFARESHRVFYILHKRVRHSRSTNESKYYFAIAELHRSDTCELHIIFVCRYIRVSIYTSPYPHRAKTRPCSKMTDRPSNQPHLRILTP